MFIKIDCQYWQLLGITIVKQIPLFLAKLLQNYLLNNFIQRQFISNLAECGNCGAAGAWGGNESYIILL
jgi:hypothetical protein